MARVTLVIEKSIPAIFGSSTILWISNCSIGAAMPDQPSNQAP